jgi:hypothetical protein
MSAPAADAAAEADAPPSLASLPAALTLQIFSLLPVDARARAACLSRGFHAVLSARSAWTRLDLSPESGVTCRVTDTVLQGAAAKAGGALVALDVSSRANVTFGVLRAVVTANSGALRELCAGGRWSLQNFDATLQLDRVYELLLAAPQLRSFLADISSAGMHHASTLRNEPPFQALRVRSLAVNARGDHPEASLLALVDAAAAHATLEELCWSNADVLSPAVLDAVVDVALSRRLAKLTVGGPMAALRRLRSVTGALAEQRRAERTVSRWASVPADT